MCVRIRLMPYTNLYGQQSNAKEKLPDPFLLNPGPWGFY
jgi:hypothetical protein